jgi:hypothetical protein
MPIPQARFWDNVKWQSAEMYIDYPLTDPYSHMSMHIKNAPKVYFTYLDNTELLLHFEDMLYIQCFIFSKIPFISLTHLVLFK